MDALRKQASKLRDQVAKQQQAVIKQFSASGYEHSDVMVIDELEMQRHQQLEKLYRSTRSGKDLQRELVKAAEAFTAIGYKHIEAGTKLSEDCCKYGVENDNDEILAKAASLYGDARKHVEKEQEDLTRLLFSQVLEPLRSMINGAPLEDARHLAQRYSRMRQEAETQATEVSRRQARVREAPIPENVTKLHAAEARMQELKANMAVLGKEASAALAAVESQQQRLTFQRLVAMVEGERMYHERVSAILHQIEAEMVSDKQRRESAPPTVPANLLSDKTKYFLAQAMHGFEASSDKELSLAIGDYVVVRKDKLSYPDVISFTKMIQGYVRNNRLNDALKLFDEMPVRDVVTWNSMIKGCFDCGNLEVAFKLFDEMPERNVVSWTTMVNGLLVYGRTEVAEQLFREMPVKDEAAWNSMIYGYFINGRVKDAMRLFHEMPTRNVISWTSMISGLDQVGKSDDALLLFKQMLCYGVRPSSVTFSSVITACANVGDYQLGIKIHGHLVKLGYLLDTYITSPLITFYAHCKDTDSCSKVFMEVSHKSVVVWTSLLTGYSLNNKHDEALEVFANMFRSGVLPNQSSFTSTINSCCELEALDRGKEINGVAVKIGLQTDMFVGNSLIVLYTKCGNLNDGLSIFKEITEKNIVSWNSMIVGCAQHGYGMWGLILFNQMMRYGVPPDDITFTGLLSACSRSGMLDKGRHIFDFLFRYRSEKVKLEHYACMVDILARKGKLNEAEELVKSMPMEPNMSIWLSLLSACKMHSDLKLAERTAVAIFKIDPNSSAAYTLLSNLYAFAGRWSEVSRIRGVMKSRGIMKDPGYSLV